MFVVKRSQHNPILNPVKERHWEAYAAFNWSVIKEKNIFHAFYRAMSMPEGFHGASFSLSAIGHAESKDGRHFDKRNQFIYPERDWEKYGCEDPRVTKFEGKYYIFYTALSEFPFSPEGIKTAIAVSSNLKTIDEKHLVAPFNSKAAVLFPERINGKILAMLTVNPDRPPSKIAFAEFEKIEQMWSPEYWKNYLEKELDKNVIDLRRLESDHIEIGAAPLNTPYGWLLIYCHIQNYFTNNKDFGIEAILLDLNDPRKIIGRTKGAFLVPEEIYEKYGHVPNVIFPSDAMIQGKKLKVFYGATDMT